MEKIHTCNRRLMYLLGIIMTIITILTFCFTSPRIEAFAENTVTVPTSVIYNNEEVYPTMINDAALYISNDGTLCAVIVPFTEEEALQCTGDSLKVILPASVKKIASNAFRNLEQSYVGCSSTLRSLTIPSSVTVGKNAFNGVTLGNIAFFETVSSFV